MLDIRTPPIKILTLVLAGVALQWIGVADSILVHVTGKDIGINVAFWFRFVCNLSGLALVMLSISYYIPDKFRLAGSLALVAISLYMLMLPGYYRIFDGPLAEYDVMPWEMITKPYQAPKERPRGPVGRPGPELALKGQNMTILALRAGNRHMDSLESASLDWKTKPHG